MNVLVLYVNFKKMLLAVYFSFSNVSFQVQCQSLFFCSLITVLQRVGFCYWFPSNRCKHNCYMWEIPSLLLDTRKRLPSKETGFVWGKFTDYGIFWHIDCINSYFISNTKLYLCFLQKQEKPKFVLCVTFSENGDAITGDSSGNILVWGKGKEVSGRIVDILFLAHFQARMDFRFHNHSTLHMMNIS